jgi:hypothetical protein
MYRGAFPFMALALLFYGGLGLVMSAKVPGTIPDEEYAINSASINDLLSLDVSQLVVIHDQTSFFSQPNNVENLAKHLRRIQKASPSISQNVLDDFKVKNKQAYLLEKLFSLRAKYEFISRQEINKFFMGNDPGGWKAFQIKYPHSTGIVGVARVGLDKDQSQALTYIENRRSDSGATGFFVFLVKENGNWKIAKTIKRSE